jgi:hypothetical protein
VSAEHHPAMHWIAVVPRVEAAQTLAEKVVAAQVAPCLDAARPLFAAVKETTLRVEIGHAALRLVDPNLDQAPEVEALASEDSPTGGAQRRHPCSQWGRHRISHGWTREKFRRHVSAEPRRVPVRY